jgi:hypothetical protein
MRFIKNRMIKLIFILVMKMNEKSKTLKTEKFILAIKELETKYLVKNLKIL